jgi:hypothetical protein
MKKHYYLCSLVLISFAACTGNGTEKTTKAVTEDSVSTKNCYLSIDGTDSSWLNLETSKSGKVTGNLLIKFEKMPKNDGEISGTMKGDTLFVDYTFKVGESDVVRKNPLALLKKDETLILGVGVIETSLGKSYFVKDKPIDFERGRFTYQPKDCQ